MRRPLVVMTLLACMLVLATAAYAIPEDSDVNGASVLQQANEHREVVPGLTRRGDEPPPTPQPTAEPTAEPTATSTPEPTPDASPEVALSSISVFQGGAVHIEVTDAQSGSVRALGRDYTLSPGDQGGLAGFVGVATGDEAGPTSLRIHVVDGSGETHSFERAVTVLETDWPVEEIWFPTPTPGPTPTPDPDPPPPLPDDNERLPEVYAGMSERQWEDPWLQPVHKPDLAGCTPARDDFPCVSSYFGYQRSFNGGAVSCHHTGTDFAAFTGTPVLATNDGTVVLAGEYRVRGNLVVVDHGGGVFSSYGHLSSLAVDEGDTVQAGDVVGEVGSTGLSTGPHLHWELVVDGVLVDGLRWLDGSQGF